MNVKSSRFSQEPTDYQLEQMKKTLLLIALTFSFLCAKGQQPKTLAFDHNAHTLIDEIGNNDTFEQLAQEIDARGTTDIQKLSLAAAWMLNHMDFDMDKFEVGSGIPDHQTVFKVKKGICGDYASLFAAFCSRFDLPNEIIEGYVPEYDSNNDVYYETNHVWNIVKLGDAWYHCDLQGFSGHLKKLDAGFTFVKQANYSSFLTQEIAFLKKHVPADPLWQLTDYPIPLASLLGGKEIPNANSATRGTAYKDRIKEYRSLPPWERKIVFAKHAYDYNKNNCSALVINYFNVAVDLFNTSKGDKATLVRSKTYFEKLKGFIGDLPGCDPFDYLTADIDQALRDINKYLP